MFLVDSCWPATRSDNNVRMRSVLLAPMGSWRNNPLPHYSSSMSQAPDSFPFRVEAVFRMLPVSTVILNYEPFRRCLLSNVYGRIERVIEFRSCQQRNGFAHQLSHMLCQRGPRSARKLEHSRNWNVSTSYKPS